MTDQTSEADSDPWWLRNDVRLIQTNLREPDARMDLDGLIETLTEFDANAWRLNTGGIAAFYPTDLEYHYESPYLERDLVGDAVEKAHANGIRVISRFDFSKAHESIFEERPEWFYRDENGDEVNYHGIVHTCVNGGYQREYSLEILEEALSRYDIDGVFFNMFGHAHWDYSRNYYGPCHCENCQRMFRAEYDLELPPKGYGEDHPAAEAYEAFKEGTEHEMLDRIRELVEGFDRDVAVSTYTPYNVDIVTSESDTAVVTDHHRWAYHTSANVAAVENCWPGKVASNLSVNAVDLPYRFTSVSEHETRVRLYQSIANGSGLDFYINGVFEGYPDQTSFDAVREVFSFHAANEEQFGDFESQADIALVKPKSGGDPYREFRGAFRALKEAHYLFDVLDQRSVEAGVADPSAYELVILPDVRTLSGAGLETLADAPDLRLVATNRSFVDSEGGREFLVSRFGADVTGRTADTNAAYVETAEETLFGRNPDRDWVFVDGTFSYVTFDPSVETALTYVTPAVFGPPERVGRGGNERSPHAGVGFADRGGATAAYLPWQVGALYDEHGFAAHSDVLLDVVDRVLGDHALPTETDAPPEIEVFFDGVSEGRYMVQALNLSGFRGETFGEPLPVQDVEVTLRSVADGAASSVLTDSDVSVESDGETTVTFDRVDTYAAAVLES
ncbi:MAG: alpha-amylase family protein [Haloarculaceae archaeon]